MLIFVLGVTSTLQFARVRRAESAARSKFSQYLPQSVVARYIDNPDDDRVAGEERPVTALFTDIEGFSTLSQKLKPRELVTLLDIYYAEVNGLVAALWRDGRQGRRRCRARLLQCAGGSR